MSVQWLRTPESRTVMTPGETWACFLPLACSGDIPRIDWACDLVPSKAIQVDETDPRRVSITLPDQMEACFGEVSYAIHTVDRVHRGRILVAVQQRIASSGKIATPPRPPKPQEPPPAKPIAAPVATDVPLAPADPADPAKPAEPLAISPTSPQAPPTPPAATPDPPRLSPAYGPVLRGEYAIDVLRQGVQVKSLTRPVVRGRTTTVGRSSRNRGIPDIDLCGQFETEEAEEACSRQQAEVFWSEEHIFVKTTGRNRIHVMENGQPGPELETLHCWQPEQVLLLPGGLQMILKKQRA